MLGLERLVADAGQLPTPGRLGLLTHPAGVTRDLTPGAVALLRAGLPLARLYGPEHGVDGSGAPGEAPEVGPDAATGLPTESLYGKNLPEIAQALRSVDTLLVDVQDVGARFYTYISTLHQVLEASREAGVRVVVLDRPNPLGFAVEGPVLRPEFQSFVGIAPIPLRHGLTLGELARFFAARLGAQAHVIPCDPRERYGGELPWVPPSPNLPDLANVALYPGTCLIEALSASEGRGTALPFRLAGAPGLDAPALASRLNRLNLPGVRFRAAHFTPTASKHAGQHCSGVQVHLTGELPQALPVGLALLGALLECGATPNEDWLQKLLGLPVNEVNTAPEAALDTCARWRGEAEVFAHAHFAPYWLYPRTPLVLGGPL